MPTIRDVATLAGVSVSTVSIIVNGQAKDRKISVETQNKVAEAIKILNYRPNVSAKKLRSNTNKEYTIGVYWASDYRTNFLARLIAGIQSEILKHNDPIHIVICPYKNDFLHKEKGLHSSITFDAAIIANTSVSDMDYLNKNVPKIPIVLYNRFSEQYNTVTIDNFEAGKKAAMLFIRNKIKDVGIVHAKESYLAMSLRSQGFIQTCIENDIVIPDENIITTENSMFGGVLAAETFLKRKQLPHGIFCDSDSIAQGMLHVFNNKHIKVPSDVAVIAIGMGSPEANKYTTPPLTVVEIPIERLATECVKLLINLLEHKIDTPSHVQCNSELIMRDSFKCGS